MLDNDNLLLQNRLLSDEIKRRVDQMMAVNIVAQTVGQSLDLDRTLQTALNAVLSVVNAEAGGISLIDDDRHEVVLRSQKGWHHDHVTQPMRIPFGRGMSGQVISNDQVLVDNDLDGTEVLAVPSFHEEQFRSIAMAPMHARGKIIGILSIMSSRPNSFSNEIVSMLSSIADTVGVALDNARLYEERGEQENRLSAILQSTADGIIAMDQDGQIQLVNAMAERMLGVAAQALHGRLLREAQINAQLRDQMIFALSSGQREHSFQAALDNGRVVSVLISPISFEAQVEQTITKDGWVMVLQDVTHLHEAALERARFMQAAAHDMRNPLAVAANSLSILDEMIAGKAGPDAQEVIVIAMDSLNRLRALIDDLLNLEQIQSGHGVKLEAVDLQEFLRELVASTKPQMDAKRLTFRQEVSANTPREVTLDRRWMQRALINYLDNAAKYTPEGRDVLLKIYCTSNELCFEVIDNGNGISLQDQSRLFERFYRVYDSDTEGISGTGLGLAIVKSIAEQHGGTVYVRSNKGQGSLFGMALPL
jgi:two-component system, NtrC family, sensor histidine kinase KinB